MTLRIRSARAASNVTSASVTWLRPRIHKVGSAYGTAHRARRKSPPRSARRHRQPIRRRLSEWDENVAAVINLLQPSAQSLLIEMAFGSTVLSTGTAFVCDTKKGPVLVTNWHNVAGRHPQT